MNNERTSTVRKKISRAYKVRARLALKSKVRLSVFRSAKHIYAQIIDDIQGITLVGVGSNNKEFGKVKGQKQVAKAVGLKLAHLAKEKNVGDVLFDRGRYKFHGRVAALAEGAREGGLNF